MNHFRRAVGLILLSMLVAESAIALPRPVARFKAKASCSTGLVGISEANNHSSWSTDLRWQGCKINGAHKALSRAEGFTEGPDTDGNGQVVFRWWTFVKGDGNF